MSSYESMARPRDTSRVGWHFETRDAVTATGLILMRIDRDVGSWRLYPADTPVAGMVDGSATPLVEGQSSASDLHYGPRWLSPAGADIARAVELLRARGALPVLPCATTGSGERHE